jgi:hypothetical protein
MATTPLISFSIGVIGNMDLDENEIQRAKEHLRLLFRLFRSEPKSEKRDELLLQLNALTSCDVISGPRPTYDNSVVEAFRQWPNLHNLPITISTNLAPGADTLAAEVAIEDEFASKRYFVKAVLPYPSDLYVGQASTYNAKRSDGTPDPSNAANQHTFHELLKGLGESSPLVVRKFGEESLDDATFYAKCKGELDENNIAARHSRYYAAGEYLAVNCDLLIAFWDSDHDKDTENGTGALVFARRFGPRQNVLPTTSSLGLPHGGPLVHIPVRRLKNFKMKAVPISNPCIRFLHPFAYTSEIKRGMIVDSSQLSTISKADSQVSGIRVMTCIVENLLLFSTLERASPADVAKEVSKRLTKQSEAYLKAHQHRNYQKLEALLQLRRSAADKQRELESFNRFFVRSMFFWIATSAILFHLFAEWHPQSLPETDDHHFDHHTKSYESPEAQAITQQGHGSNQEHDDGIRPVLGVLSAISVLLGIGTYCFAKRLRYREKSDDLRALAEGLRVQFYWNLTGVGKSVPANYSLRQRSELDWIRGVIRATSTPYDQWTRWFNDLDNPSRVSLFEACLNGWIHEQETYFSERSEEKHNELHFWHRSGILFAWSGVFIALFLVCLNTVGFRMELLQRHSWLLVSFIPISATLAFVIAASIRGNRSHVHAHRNPFKGYLWQSIFRAQDEMLPLDDQYMSSGFLAHSLRNFWIGLPSIALVVVAGILSMSLIAKISGDFGIPVPDAFTLSSVLAGALLLSGGLFIAWAEKQQLSETGYQYNTMATLFRSARIQFEKHLNDLRDLTVKENEFASQVRSDNILTNTELPLEHIDAAANPKEILEKVQNARKATTIQLQEFIYELGREALDENAEWLILHRARPLEPVMAG